MVDLRTGDDVNEVHPLPRGDGWVVDGIEVTPMADGRWQVRQGEALSLAHGTRIGDVVWLHINGRVHRIEVIEAGAGAAQEEGSFSAPMPGGVLDVLVATGDEVTAGQALLVLEAMKMETEISAPKSGSVSGVFVKEGDTVEVGDILFTIT